MGKPAARRGKRKRSPSGDEGAAVILLTSTSKVASDRKDERLLKAMEHFQYLVDSGIVNRNTLSIQVNDEFFAPPQMNWCILCDEIIRGRLNEHFRYHHDLEGKPHLKEGLTTISRCAAENGRGVTVDVAAFPPPETLREYAIHQMYINCLEKQYVSVKNKASLIPPSSHHLPAEEANGESDGDQTEVMQERVEATEFSSGETDPEPNDLDSTYQNMADFETGEVKNDGRDSSCNTAYEGGHQLQGSSGKLDVAELGHHLLPSREAPLEFDETSSSDVAMFNKLITKHNNLECKQATFQSAPHNFASFNSRKQCTPVQDWPWLMIKDVPTIDQKGLFAKIAIRRGSVLCDYRGQTMLVEHHMRRLAEVDEKTRKHMADYFFQHSFVHQGKTIHFGIEAHQRVYSGTAVLGRYINHSNVHPNARARFHKKQVGKTLHIAVYFETTKDVKAGEQLLYDYGRYFADEDWHSTCLCNDCLGVSSDTFSGLSPVDLALPKEPGVSMSQSLSDAPLTVQAEHGMFENYLLSVEIMVGARLTVHRATTRNWMDALTASRFAFNFQAPVQVAHEQWFLSMLRTALKCWDDERLLTVLLLTGDRGKTTLFLVIGDARTGTMAGGLMCDHSGTSCKAIVAEDETMRNIFVEKAVEQKKVTARVPSLTELKLLVDASPTFADTVARLSIMPEIP